MVSKLKRFNENDQSDIKAMIDRGLVFVEREFLGVPEIEFEPPDWADM